MNAELSNSLLQEVTHWDSERLAQEQPVMEFMGSMKYDSYDQFMPGNRFMASLVQWLSQFEEVDKEIMYDLIKNKLIFISSTQMSYLVGLLYNTIIKPVIITQVAVRLGIEKYFVKKIEASEDFKCQKRLSLIVGLSDGAHTDILRRTAEFSNEQVLNIYYPNDEKIDDLLKELQKDELLQSKGRSKFETLFLVDDFTASGTSFVRLEEMGSKKEYKGKLVKVIDAIFGKEDDCSENKDNSFCRLFNLEKPLEIRIFFCIATEYALEKIKRNIKDYLDEKNLDDKVNVIVDCVLKIEESLSESIRNDTRLERVLKKSNYFDSAHVMSDSYMKGKTDKPYYGFNECALPLVLSHNTPNNSLPILWQDGTFKGLFPRISRH